ncbi:MAG: hypothetical protein PHV82_12355 [Victivallaceae bacterium]|nr:hypothetical protein [Victivallaceae bacterium]
MLKLACFKVDVTPPVGACAGFNAKTLRIRDPLFARGLILDDASARLVLVSLDYCALVHSAYEQLRAALAAAAGTGNDRVLIHCIHQHDAPLVDFEAVKYLETPEQYGWWPEMLAKCAAAAGEAVRHFREVAEISSASYCLEGYASNRRVAMPDGTIAARWSRCRDERIRNAPLGIIDLMLKTVAFRDADGNILGSLSFYATHPQVANTGDKFSADAPGEALRQLGDESGLHLFFTGCGGNVTAGKYSTQEPETNLLHFGKKLAVAIRTNLERAEWRKAGKLDWQSVAFSFPRREFGRRELQDKLQSNPGDASSAALLGVMDFGPAPYTIYKLRSSGINIFFLPGELFVEYQLFINSLYPEEFVAVAANCRDDFFYCPLAADFKTVGGYETQHFCYTNGEFETRFKAAAREASRL